MPKSRIVPTTLWEKSLSSPAFHLERVTPHHRDALEQLLLQCTRLPLDYLPTCTHGMAAKLQAHQLAEKSAHDDVVMLGAYEEATLTGLALLEPLSWDSAQYGLAMGRIGAFHLAAGARSETAAHLLSAILKESRRMGWQFIDFQPHASELTAINAACSLGFQLVSTTLGLAWDLSRILPARPESFVRLRTATREDAEAVGVAAYAAIDPFSRFACDPKLGVAKAPAIFQAWARNSVLGYADRVAIAEGDDNIVGYCTWRKHRGAESILGLGHVNLDLTAVREEARGRHALSALMHEGLAHWQEQGLTTAEVVTHVLNGGMQRAAHRFGAHAMTARHALHWHA